MEDVYLGKHLPQLLTAARLTREQSHRDVLHPSFQMSDNFFISKAALLRLFLVLWLKDFKETSNLFVTPT